MALTLTDFSRLANAYSLRRDIVLNTKTEKLSANWFHSGCKISSERKANIATLDAFRKALTAEYGIFGDHAFEHVLGDRYRQFKSLRTGDVTKVFDSLENAISTHIGNEFQRLMETHPALRGLTFNRDTLLATLKERILQPAHNPDADETRRANWVRSFAAKCTADPAYLGNQVFEVLQTLREEGEIQGQPVQGGHPEALDLDPEVDSRQPIGLRFLAQSGATAQAVLGSDETSVEDRVRSGSVGKGMRLNRNVTSPILLEKLKTNGVEPGFLYRNDWSASDTTGAMLDLNNPSDHETLSSQVRAHMQTFAEANPEHPMTQAWQEATQPGRDGRTWRSEEAFQAFGLRFARQLPDGMAFATHHVLHNELNNPKSALHQAASKTFALFLAEAYEDPNLAPLTEGLRAAQGAEVDALVKANLAKAQASLTEAFTRAATAQRATERAIADLQSHTLAFARENAERTEHNQTLRARGLPEEPLIDIDAELAEESTRVQQLAKQANQAQALVEKLNALIPRITHITDIAKHVFADGDMHEAHSGARLLLDGALQEQLAQSDALLATLRHITRDAEGTMTSEERTQLLTQSLEAERLALQADLAKGLTLQIHAQREVANARITAQSYQKAPNLGPIDETTKDLTIGSVGLLVQKEALLNQLTTSLRATQARVARFNATLPQGDLRAQTPEQLTATLQATRACVEATHADVRGLNGTFSALKRKPADILEQPNLLRAFKTQCFTHLREAVRNYGNTGRAQSDLPVFRHFSDLNIAKLDYNESERSGENLHLPLRNKAKKPGYFNAIRNNLYQGLRVITRAEANNGAVSEALSNDLMRMIGIPSQELTILNAKDAQDRDKLLLTAKLAKGYQDLTHHMQDGVITQPKDPASKTYQSLRVPDLGKYKILLLLLGDRDAVGSKGNNKGLIFRENGAPTFFAIDPGHSLEGNGPALAISEDFSFQDTKQPFFSERFLNFSVFDDTPYMEKFEGVLNIRDFSEENLETLCASYVQTLSQTLSAPEEMQGVIKRIDAMKAELRTQKGRILDVFQPRLAVYDALRDNVGEASARAAIETLSDLEKASSETSRKSPNGTVQLNYTRILPGARVPWSAQVNNDNTVTFSTTELRDNEKLSALATQLQAFQPQTGRHALSVTIPLDQIQAFAQTLHTLVEG